MLFNIGGYRGGIDPTGSAMYGQYHAGFDTVVTSYGHKQQLLRETGLVESSDAHKGSKCHIPSDYSESNPNKGRAAPPTNVEWVGP
jgi:hypothetical protein